MQRLIALTRGVDKPHHYIRITVGAKSDAAYWLRFLAHYNGITPILETEWLDSRVLQFYTDASDTGYGAYFAGEWFKGRWVDGVREMPIAVREMFAVTLAVRAWGQQLRNRKLIIWCDNQCVTYVFAKQFSKCGKLSFLLRELVLACLNFNVLVKMQYIASEQNFLADSLSRDEMHRFWMAAPATTSPSSTETPDACAMQLALRSANS